MAMFEDLLSRGYLPVQLPPNFTSETFANELPNFQAQWDAIGTPPSTLFERFSVPRSSYYRRITAILNPISFYYLARDITQYWAQIQAHYAKSPLSKSTPVIAGGLRAITIPKFSELYEEKITAAAGFRYALITDVSAFFPTIYTHVIPWALHTKAVAKANKAKIPVVFGNILDGRSMGVQDGQTIGLPIGPDTSHILAETVAVAIDEQIIQTLGGVPRGFRYVDDFFFFFSKREEAERALAAVTRAVSDYQLQVNASKTRIIETKELVEESWKYAIKRLSVSSARRQQRDDIHHYFESLFSLEKRFKDESLVKYGVKQISSTIIKKSNWNIFESYLLKCAYGFPNTIQVIAHILSTYQHHGYPVDKDAVFRLCNNLIAASAASDHHGEVAWLLWVCKQLDIDLSATVVDEIERMASPVCTLMLLDLQHAGTVTTPPAAGALTQYAAAGALQSAEWLLAYEGGRRHWLGNADTNFIDNHAHFGPLRVAGVRFYDENKVVPPIFDFKTPAETAEDFDFDTDAEIEEEFDFDEMDEEYFDSSDV
ncbi:RNA-directed DNA polymerase [Paraburkholderia caballeronis]|uniref:Reverse transcriptase (RNA-dependent DNA polymerase) n=1 Tax=Paraburkholderia caballeronis TaxID=416943 RepID=A0A1H7L2L6_9BURK|nr:RNA-directed DNA polymerase [Paraburkholderia caballeronis]PXW28268.1 reverse transcriptase (RNA-dependent DNA polymerase) [Paraburkholderia caballeronis]PXX03634.1 reverse transcriptase (RNA-dependent DNA polymerase) [Paraburkholderia caballeronis]RAK04378.1 reverse transcriptase (RNA-dependent DNA polymerase) [Paraburkholderia caballeronis]SED82624.1 Reverse transcriptase (RNA-dependent DNA polymerase) [Paraburkholderia caballeronis]SEK93242.1 Reverse transcriptase (RNA-dependent DNA poly